MDPIDDLLSRYCFAIDGGDGDGWLECFTEDGTFRSASADGVHVDLAGRAEMVEWIRTYHGAIPPWSVKHVVTGRHFDIADDTASGVVGYLTLTSATDGGITVQTAGRYLDELRLGADGRWRFASRTAHRDLGRLPG